MKVKSLTWSQHLEHPLKYNQLALLTEMIQFYFKETTFFICYMCILNKLLIHLVIVKDVNVN